MTNFYGYIRDLPGHRDKKFVIAERLTLPTSVDLRDLCPPVEDQGQLGSCTSFAGGAAIRVARKIQGLADFTTSHLFLYYNSRSKNTKSVDAGATIRDTIKSAAKIGDCPELEWPYDLNQFTTKPPQSWQPKSEEHTSELQSHLNLVCRLLLEKKKNRKHMKRAT